MQHILFQTNSTSELIQFILLQLIKQHQLTEPLGDILLEASTFDTGLYLTDELQPTQSFKEIAQLLHYSITKENDIFIIYKRQ